MTEGRTPEGEPTPISEDTTATTNPPPLAPYVEQASIASSPTPAPAPAAPPPPIAWAAPPVAVAAAGGRTTLAAIAGVGLIILGVLGGLLGLMVAVFGSSIVTQLDLSQYGGDFGGLNDPAAVVSGAIAFVGIVIVVYSLVYFIGGIGVVRSRGWGRVMGLIVGTLSGLFWLMSLTGSGSGANSGLGFALVMVAIHVYIVVVLIMFWRRKTA